MSLVPVLLIQNAFVLFSQSWTLRVCWQILAKGTKVCFQSFWVQLTSVLQQHLEWQICLYTHQHCKGYDSINVLLVNNYSLYSHGALLTGSAWLMQDVGQQKYVFCSQALWGMMENCDGALIHMMSTPCQIVSDPTCCMLVRDETQFLKRKARENNR